MVPTFKEMDKCLTSLYEKFQSNDVLPRILEGQEKKSSGEGFDSAKMRVRKCGVVLAEELHNVVNKVFTDHAPSEGLLWSTAGAADSERDLLSPIRETCNLPEATAGLLQIRCPTVNGLIVSQAPIPADLYGGYRRRIKALRQRGG